MKKKAKEEFKTITIMKYRLGSGYDFVVLDKFDYEDEVERLNELINLSREMKFEFGDEYEQLWIKETPII